MKKSKSTQPPIDRRSFLLDLMKNTATAGFLLSPGQILLQNMLLGAFHRAHAADPALDSSFFEKKFVHLSMRGGPPRWMWDLPLRPNGTADGFSANKQNDPTKAMLITRFVSGAGPGGVLGQYHTVNIGGLQVPYLWASKIPTPNGGLADMSPLLQHMLMMRGIDMQIDSHEIDRAKTMEPVSGSSLFGMVADVSQTVVPMVSVGYDGVTSNTYNSKKGVPLQVLNHGNPFGEAFSAFSVSNPSTLRTLSSAESAIDGALSLMKAQAGGKSKYLPNSYQDRANAKKLMKTQFTGLQEKYTQLYNKYESLVTRSFGDPAVFLAGVEDVTIAGNANEPIFAYGMGVDDINVNSIYTGSDMKVTANRNATIANLATGFAVAEFMLGGDRGNPNFQSFSSCININVGGDILNLFCDQVFDRKNNQTITNKIVTTSMDMHETGSYATLILSTKYFRAIAACLYEFMFQMKAQSVGSKTLFDQMVVGISSEFNRSARDNGSGSDHGFLGSNYTIFSGMVPRLTVLGDISIAQPQSGYSGTWGVGAKMPEFSNQVATIGNAASTVCAMLGLKSPSPNTPSYVSVGSSGLVVPAVHAALNKGGPT